MTLRYAQQFLVDCLVAQGTDPKVAEAAVLSIWALEVAAEINPLKPDAWDRDARIYDLRGQRLTSPVLAVRFRLHPVQVFKIVRRHGKRRRAALRLVS